MGGRFWLVRSCSYCFGNDYPNVLASDSHNFIDDCIYTCVRTNWGSIINFIAVLIASSVGYVIGKYLGLSFIERLLGEKTTKKITGFIEDHGFWAIVITRINPFLSNDAISFVAGILKMSYWKFISATAVGITPLISLIAITGQNTNSLKTGLLYGSIASLVIFGGYIWWDKKRKSTL